MSEKILTYSEQYGGDYLEPVLLDGKDCRVIIEKIDPKGTVRRADNNRMIDKPILHFKGKTRALPLNKTCARVIAMMYGTNMNEWVGKEITIYPTTCDAFGEEDVPCIRVRPGKPRVILPEEPR